MTQDATNTQALIAERSARYAALKASGQAPKTLPPPTPLDAAPIPPNALLLCDTLPGGAYWTSRIPRGVTLRVLNASGTPGVSAFFWNAQDPSERYNSADTIKIQWTAELRKGRVLFSDMGRVLASIVEDSCCAHDTVVGGSTPASNVRKYGDAGLRSTRENMILAASKFGLGPRDLAPLLTLFAAVTNDEDGRLAFLPDAVKPGDFVDLRAEMDLLVAVSNCPHPLAPDTVFAPGEIELTLYRSGEPGADDLCRTATQEAIRGFENNARWFAAQ